ncbi:MAG: hypothetical protein ACI9U2_003684, partial [Bradymonadia bacterium]
HRPVRARVAEKMRKGGFSVLIPIPTRLVEPRLNLDWWNLDCR